MPEMHYEEKEILLHPGDTLLFHSDGLVEAHNPQQEMVGFTRLKEWMGAHPGGVELVPHLLETLAHFTGPHWEQEDDVTLVVLQCQPIEQSVATPGKPEEAVAKPQDPAPAGWRPLAGFSLASELGNERQAMLKVMEIVEAAQLLPARRLEMLGTAVAEAVMNAMEHGNRYQPDLNVDIQILANQQAVLVRVLDQGGDQPIPAVAEPDLDAKLSGAQPTRGWGLFLIEKMVDEMHIVTQNGQHCLELIFNLEGTNGEPTAKAA
jgi:anti-sigma regulatory factor (Ser/Thr protein kinase)